MLAIVYLVAATYFGDCICRRFFCFRSLQQRVATSFLVGLLLSSWIVFLSAVGFHRFSQPLIAANLVFLFVTVPVAWIAWRYPRKTVDEPALLRPPGSTRWDLVWLGAFLVFAGWLMFATLGVKDGQFQIAFKAWTDFGANVSLTQSFALGHNFPPEHPFFPGEFIRYHFMFWFQAANLEFLGLNPVWSINLLSVVSLLALLVEITMLGELLFNSRAVGRIAALLFFFSSSLSYLPFLKSQSGFRAALNAIFRGTEFLASGYPFRGETWGALSANVFAYQRHLISGIGLLVVVLVFIADRYRTLKIEKEVEPELRTSEPVDNIDDSVTEELESTPAVAEEASVLVETSPPMLRASDFAPWIFCGAIIGLLPYWNSPTYVAALAICGCLLVLMPFRWQTASLIGAAILVGLPQVLWLRSGNVISHPFLYLGYTIENPSLFLIVKYLLWTFGVKWILLGVAAFFAAGWQRRLLLAMASLVVIVFLFQLSTDIFNNHKLLNIWATLVNVYAAYALWQIARHKIAGIVLAIVLAVSTVFGGAVDLFPLHNDPMLAVPYQKDRLSQWLTTNTNPSDIFLTHQLLTHQILFTGRKIYLGYTLFAWTAGYNVPERETLYRRMFQEGDVTELVRLLRENKIAYVAIDDGVRHNDSLPDLNEAVYEQHFAKVFEDTEHTYDNVVIYKVP
ncbi:MAG TPA: hypothetical protein VJT71_12245 [Pyrinomonadaceae bacterium]|nr:hypothetical protein [Pyrinomonadaceae bacterium]